jgi:hypothetical protein
MAKAGTTLAATVFREEPQLREEAEATTLFQEIVGRARRLTVGGESYFVLEGDLLYDEDEVRLYAMQRENRLKSAQVGGTPAVSAEDALAILAPGGTVVRWRPEKVLTYCVLRDSFDDAERHASVVRWAAEAASGWTAITGVQFRHLAELDSGDLAAPTPEGIREDLVFGVRFDAALGESRYAIAFFPTYSSERRWVRAGPPLFEQTSVNPAGVLRHELGHVLGFRHEHIRPEAPLACPDEELSDVLGVTEYDTNSVMHYPCTAFEHLDLQFTKLDRVGAQRVYGAASIGPFRFVD